MKKDGLAPIVVVIILASILATGAAINYYTNNENDNSNQNQTENDQIFLGGVDCGVSDEGFEVDSCIYKNLMTCTPAKEKFDDKEGEIVMMTVGGYGKDGCIVNIEILSSEEAETVGMNATCSIPKSNLDEKVVNYVFENWRNVCQGSYIEYLKNSM